MIVFRRIVACALAVVLVGVVAAWAVYLRPLSLGGPAEFVVIHGDSMLPRLRTGDLVVVHAQPAYHPGEVIAYRVPRGNLGARTVVLHRIVGGDAAAGFVVKGDNNTAPDPWHPRQSDILGSEWVAVPQFGAYMVWARSPAAAAGFAASVSIVLVLFKHRPARSAARRAATAVRGLPHDA